MYTYICIYICTYMRMYMYIYMYVYMYVCLNVFARSRCIGLWAMGWLRSVGSIKL